MQNNKRTPEEIGTYFNGEVERFSNLATGQASIKDARLMMDLLAETAKALAPDAKTLLDVGCGAGNQILNLLRVFPGSDCHLLDISTAMRERAQERVGAATAGRVTLVTGDLRNAELPEGKFDVAVAAAVLHHMRSDADWELAFGRIWRALRPGGVLLVSDLICHANPCVEAQFKVRHAQFLKEALGDAEAARILKSVAESDTPSPLEYQFAKLRAQGFREVALLHKTLVFGAYYAVK